MHPRWERPSGMCASSMSVAPDKNLAFFAPGPEGHFGDLVPEVAQISCSASQHLSCSSSIIHVLLLVLRLRHHESFTFAFQSELSCEHFWSWSEEEGHPRVDHAEEGLNDPPSCDATGYTEMHNVTRTCSAHSSVPVETCMDKALLLGGAVWPLSLGGVAFFPLFQRAVASLPLLLLVWKVLPLFPS